jgi:glutamate synthase domain-containing protein 3
MRHREYTSSTVADGLLADWPKAAGRFVKVMPKEYRRVLNQQQAAQVAEAQVVSNG